MIVQPDFLTHWKTRKLINRIGHDQAPLYVIRLWALCQTSRRDTVPADAETIGAICEFKGDVTKLHKALVDCGFLDAEEDGFHKVHEWAEVNSRLLHNWAAGVRGGRPKGSKQESLGKPLGFPQGTDGGDKIREEKIDKMEKTETTQPLHAFCFNHPEYANLTACVHFRSVTPEQYAHILQCHPRADAVKSVARCVSDSVLETGGIAKPAQYVKTRFSYAETDGITKPEEKCPNCHWDLPHCTCHHGEIA